MSLETYGPPERGSGTWTDENRAGKGGSDSMQKGEGRQAKEGNKGGRIWGVIEREREERC